MQSFCKQVKRTTKSLLLPLLPTVIFAQRLFLLPCFPPIFDITNKIHMQHADLLTSQQPALTSHFRQNNLATLQKLILNWTAGSAEVAVLGLESTLKTKWVKKTTTSGTRSITARILYGVFAKKSRGWLLWEAVMLSAILYLRACLLILMIGFVFQRCLACAHQEVPRFRSENTTGSVLRVVGQTYVPTSCKSINECLLRITHFLSAHWDRAEGLLALSPGRGAVTPLCT